MADITRVAGIVEPARAYNFEVFIERAPAGVEWLENFSFRAKEITIPAQEFDKIEIRYKWMKWEVHGLEGGDKTIEVSCWDGIDLAIYKNLYAWRKLVGDWLTGKQSLRKDITGEIRIVLYDGTDNVIGSVKLYQAFLSGLKDVSLSWANNEVVDVKGSFAYTWLEFEK